MAQDTMMTHAPEVQAIAEQLMRTYHPELVECSILYLFTTAEVPCAPKKCSPEWRYAYSLHLPGCPKAAVDEGPDFRLLINLEEWDFLVPGQQEPYIDHRLEHIVRKPAKDGGVRWVLKPDDISEMNATVKRWGRYNAAVKQFGQILQPELDLSVPDEQWDRPMRVVGGAEA